MSHVDTTREPRLERILSEIRTQRKRIEAAERAAEGRQPGSAPSVSPDRTPPGLGLPGERDLACADECGHLGATAPRIP